MPLLPLPRFTRRDLLASVHFDPRWPAIGPHEGRAAWLMQAGWKPAAYFCDGADVDPGDDEAALSALAETGIILKHQRRLNGLAPRRICAPLRETIYVLPSFTDLVQSLRRVSAHWEKGLPDIGYGTEVAFGRSLGYGADDIRHFILRSYG